MFRHRPTVNKRRSSPKRDSPVNMTIGVGIVNKLLVLDVQKCFHMIFQPTSPPPNHPVKKKKKFELDLTGYSPIPREELDACVARDPANFKIITSDGFPAVCCGLCDKTFWGLEEVDQHIKCSWLLSPIRVSNFHSFGVFL
jgi:hypothetical protein